MLSQSVVKTIGANGQISLGKQYAGHKVLIEEQEHGVWLIRTADVVPHNERWLHSQEHKAKLEGALAWVEEHGVSDKNADAVLSSLERVASDAE